MTHPVRFTVITYPKTDPRLGRVVEHDERSRDYAFTLTSPQQVNTDWTSSAPVLDQGDIGSCTGNAMAQCLGTDYFAGKGLREYLDEADALALYELATRLDHMPGEYPPTDRGSSGIAVAKAAEKLSYITRYEHTFGWAHFQAAIETQPVIVGTPWTQQMMTPDNQGHVTVGELSDYTIIGGHEYLCRGINYDTQLVTFRNSWGTGWGNQGEFTVSFIDFETLLANEGDVTVPQR